MAAKTRSAVLRNPFFVVLMLTSTAFLVTVLLLFVDTLRQQPDLAARGAGGPSAVSAWLGRHGMTALTVEFAAMLGSALLAMATDDLFAPRPKPGDRT